MVVKCVANVMWDCCMGFGRVNQCRLACVLRTALAGVAVDSVDAGGLVLTGSGGTLIDVPLTVHPWGRREGRVHQ